MQRARKTHEMFRDEDFGKDATEIQLCPCWDNTPLDHSEAQCLSEKSGSSISHMINGSVLDVCQNLLCIRDVCDKEISTTLDNKIQDPAIPESQAYSPNPSSTEAQQAAFSSEHPDDHLNEPVPVHPPGFPETESCNAIYNISDIEYASLMVELCTCPTNLLKYSKSGEEPNFFGLLPH